MAEFINQPTPKHKDIFANMGKPVPVEVKEKAYEECKDMGMTDRNKIFSCVESVSSSLERDNPYTAVESAMKYLDMTGAYRLMAKLLAY